MNIVLDSNIFIAALLKDSKIRDIIVNSEGNFLFPEAILDEINEHKEELLIKSGLSGEEFNELTSRLMKYLTIVPNLNITGFKEEANSIVGEIDKDDVPFIATSLAFDCCPIWSDDRDLKKQGKIEILSTKEIIERLEANK